MKNIPVRSIVSLLIIIGERAKKNKKSEKESFSLRAIIFFITMIESHFLSEKGIKQKRAV